MPRQVRVLDPPVRVWIKTAKLLPPAWDRSGQRLDGLRIEVEAPGLLHHWAPTSDGGWLGWVTYEIWTADEQWTVPLSHYAPAHLIRRRGLSRRNRGDMPRRRTHGKRNPRTNGLPVRGFLLRWRLSTRALGSVRVCQRSLVGLVAHGSEFRLVFLRSVGQQRDEAA